MECQDIYNPPRLNKKFIEDLFFLDIEKIYNPPRLNKKVIRIT